MRSISDVTKHKAWRPVDRKQVAKCTRQSVPASTTENTTHIYLHKHNDENTIVENVTCLLHSTVKKVTKTDLPGNPHWVLDFPSHWRGLSALP